MSEDLFSILRELVKDSTDAPAITPDQLGAFLKRIHQFLFHFRHTDDNVATIPPLWSTLYPLLTYVSRLDKFNYLQRLAYALVNRKDDLHKGMAISPWEGSVNSEWSVLEVLKVECINPHLPVASQDCDITCLALSGRAAGARAIKRFSRKALSFLSKDLGFAKVARFGKPSHKPVIHPYFSTPEDVQGFVWYGLVQPCEAYPPRYFDMRCSSSMMNYNRDLIRKRRNGHETSGGRPLVQPQPRLYPGVHPVVSGNVPQAHS